MRLLFVEPSMFRSLCRNLFFVITYRRCHRGSAWCATEILDRDLPNQHGSEILGICVTGSATMIWNVLTGSDRFALDQISKTYCPDGML